MPRDGYAGSGPRPHDDAPARRSEYAAAPEHAGGRCQGCAWGAGSTPGCVMIRQRMSRFAAWCGRSSCRLWVIAAVQEPLAVRAFLAHRARSRAPEPRPLPAPAARASPPPAGQRAGPPAGGTFHVDPARRGSTSSAGPASAPGALPLRQAPPSKSAENSAGGAGVARGGLLPTLEGWRRPRLRLCARAALSAPPMVSGRSSVGGPDQNVGLRRRNCCVHAQSARWAGAWPRHLIPLYQ